MSTTVAARILLWLAAVGPLASIAAADEARDRAVSADREAMAGEWRIVSIERDGRRVDSKGMIVTVVNGVDGRWQLLTEGRPVAEGFNGIDPTTSPKTIDLVGVQAALESLRGRNYLGIYEITGNTRRMCIAPAGRPRPATFSAAEGSGCTLIALERIVFQ